MDREHIATPSESASARIADFREVFETIRSEIGRVVVGHREVIEQILVAFFAGGHVLIEGVPGTGKTLIVRTLAQVLNLRFGRVQFTVDLMPADITGTRIVTEADGRREFVFCPGPVFTNILLADEINRATPKTQSALLEAMAEMQVTVAGSTYPLKPPFFTLATLNPIEMEGTYPLPEAQLDRFMFKTVLEYPTTTEMREILSTTTVNELPAARPIFTAEEAPVRVEALKTLVRQVLVAPHLHEYASHLVRATCPSHSKFAPSARDGIPADERIDRYVSFGSSPRGGQALLLGAKVYALIEERANVSAKDIQRAAVPALAHRLVLNFAAQADQIDARHLVERVVDAAKRLVN